MREHLKFLTLLIACIGAVQVSAHVHQNNHITTNLPSTYEEFTEIVQRDLDSYFSKAEKESVSTSYELLRKQPTQSGVAYPRFYAWVVISINNKIIKQGAIRLTAIDGTRVDVTDFIKSDDIVANPSSIESVFPKSLCDGIRQRAHKA